MNSKTEDTVGGIAVTSAAATRILEQFGIDYCCGGAQSLASACKSLGLDVDNVQEAIRNIDPAIRATKYSDYSQRELANHIVHFHHEFAREEIGHLTSLLIPKVVSAHGSRHPELAELQKAFTALAGDLMPHMQKEERVLFPYIVQLEAVRSPDAMPARPPFGSVQNPVGMMLFEHERAGALLRELRRITSNYTAPSDACASYKALYHALQNFERDLRLHVHLENNILFPRAIEMEMAARQPSTTAS